MKINNSDIKDERRIGKMGERVNLKVWLATFMFLLGVGCTAAAARTIYVDDDGPADFNTIQAAIDDSNDGDTVIVADGIYTGEGNRDIEFSHGLPEGQTRAITVQSANGPGNCIIDCNGSENDHHRGFRFGSGEDANSVINGFTITNGHAPLEEILPPIGMMNSLGGAVLCWWGTSPTITNCVFINNKATSSYFPAFGGGIACHRGNATITNCTFVGNQADNEGGGLYNYGSSSTITNCTLIGNSADRGGGMGSFDSSPTVTNCTFSGNTASVNGGGISCRYETYLMATNCILWGDGPDEIYMDESTLVITYSNVDGGWLGESNIGNDPCFADPCYGDYHLKSQGGRWEPESESWVQNANTSPCIDAGDLVSPIGLEPFPNGGRVNMGAYGGTARASKSYFGGPVCEIIVAGDINGDCIVNYKDFAFIGLNWLRDENQ